MQFSYHQKCTLQIAMQTFIIVHICMQVFFFISTQCLCFFLLLLPLLVRQSLSSVFQKTSNLSKKIALDNLVLIGQLQPTKQSVNLLKLQVFWHLIKYLYDFWAFLQFFFNFFFQKLNYRTLNTLEINCTLDNQPSKNIL